LPAEHARRGSPTMQLGRSNVAEMSGSSGISDSLHAADTLRQLLDARQTLTQ
jgi:hypothetical protein